MAREIYRKIIDLVMKAVEMVRTVGIHNLLQPGLVKEMVIANILGHELITAKRGADARNSKNPSQIYEYLSCKEGGSGQPDRMFRRPNKKRQESLNRIRRSDRIYDAVFYKHNQMKVKVIYKLEPEIVVRETERQLDRSGNEISHVGFSERWVRENGKIVYEDKKG